LSKFYIVGSPIGNLEDITKRAIDILSGVDLIFTEDTRVSKKLLSKYNISTKTAPIYNKAKKVNLGQFKYAIEKHDVAFLTDAGTPGISDPVAQFVKISSKEQHEIIPIPGASSLTSAFSVSGFDSKNFIFLGFPPKSKIQFQKYINEYIGLDLPIILFESPKRLITTLRFLKDEFVIQNIFVGKEMTKLYEKIYMGSIDRAIELFSNAKGEFVIIFKREVNKLSKSSINKYDKILSKGYKEGIKGKELITLLSELTGENKKFFYNRWLGIKNKNE
tara:strand:+ start:1274 stop:2101 length:828 start_codon:yes stop_codon:yes gene_type:complete